MTLPRPRSPTGGTQHVAALRSFASLDRGSMDICACLHDANRCSRAQSARYSRQYRGLIWMALISVPRPLRTATDPGGGIGESPAVAGVAVAVHGVFVKPDVGPRP